jgi:four helix bundle protein
MRNFRNYRERQHAMDLVKEVYRLTKNLPETETYSLARQMQKAAVSIPSNIAEGCSRTSEKDFRRFVEISMGSTYELETQTILTDNLFGLSKIAEYDLVLELLSLVQVEPNALRNTLK